jgi:hypothetical protein
MVFFKNFKYIIFAALSLLPPPLIISKCFWSREKIVEETFTKDLGL